MLLSIIIVNYNSGNMLTDCLRSIYESSIDFEHEVIVIDNASSDDSIKQAKALFNAVLYIENNENLGFAKANNQGIRLAKGDYILIQNPDTIVIDRAIEELVNYSSAYPGIGIASGKLLNDDQTLQHSIRRFPTISGQIFEAFFIHKLLPRLSRSFGEVVLNREAYERPLDVDWVCGAIMLVDRAAIAQVGMLDESFFLYAEELDWCYRMRSNGWRVVYYPEAVFVHFHGKTRAKLQLYIQHLKARSQFNHKHFRKLKARAFDMAGFMFLLNRVLLFSALSTIKPSEETAYMRDLFYQSGRAFLKMMINGIDSSENTLQRNRL